MRLSQLCAAAGLRCPAQREITALTCRSDEVGEGCLFAALKGANTDGRNYIPRALKKGAAAILCEGEGTFSAPTVHTGDCRASLALMAGEFYGHPAQQMTMIALTGTKGKTTTAHMLREIFLAAGCRVGMIGTLGAFIDREEIAPPCNTTPEPVLLHRILRQMSDAGCTHVVMEVSSQAMKQERLAGIMFDAAVFLNFSPDHIGPGEHESLEEYRNCKAALFRQCRLAVGNGEDDTWQHIKSQIPSGVPILELPPCEIRAGEGLSTLLRVDEREYRIPLPGTFNGKNALAAVTLCRELGVDEGTIGVGLERVSVPGRCMVYPAPAPYGVMVDYAHNGASFRAIFSALRQQSRGRIIAVFGAGGDRPPMRRHDLGCAAAEGADFAVLTEDNPRSESVETICAQIEESLGDLPHVIIPDRRKAVFYALDLAQPGDVVVLLGKGHEQYIESEGVRRPYSEWRVLDDYFLP